MRSLRGFVLRLADCNLFERIVKAYEQRVNTVVSLDLDSLCLVKLLRQGFNDLTLVRMLPL